MWLKKLSFMLLWLLLFSLQVESQDVSAAREAIAKSKLLLTALEQNLAQREAALVVRESSLNEANLSLEAREAFLSKIELDLQKQEQNLVARENSLAIATSSFETLDKAFKKQSWRLGLTKTVAWVGWGAALAGWVAFAASALF